MIRVFKLFCKLNISAKDLFLKFMTSFNPNSHKCPYCSTKHPDWKKRGVYERYLISFENGHAVYYQVSIVRYKCSSCNHTHAILSEFIIPYQSYSLHFILAALQDYFTHSLTVAEICSKYDISASTLYLWKNLFLNHKKLWLGVLEDMLTSSVSFINFILDGSFIDMLRDFFALAGYSFLQGVSRIKKAHSTPPWYSLNFSLHISHKTVIYLLFTTCYDICRRWFMSWKTYLMIKIMIKQ